MRKRSTTCATCSAASSCPRSSNGCSNGCARAPARRPATAALIISRLRAAYTPPIDEASAPLQPVNFDQLAWFGLNADTLERLRPLLTLLPAPTPVNLNTAPREVIAALFDGVDLASAERLVQARKAAPLQTLPAGRAYLPEAVILDPARASVQSAYFFVTGRLRLDERVLQHRSLIFRNGLSMVTLQRQMLNQGLNAPAGRPG